MKRENAGVKLICLAGHVEEDAEIFESATAIYTGGGIYCYYGKLKDGSYFMASDCWEYDILILDADPLEDIEASGYPEWQEKHYISEKIDDFNFWNRMINWIIANAPDGNYDPYDLEIRKF